MNFDIIPAKQMTNYIEKDRILIIDLRKRVDYLKGHVPYAVNIPYDNLENHQEILKNYYELILYCDRGGLSLLAAKDLSRKGFRVKNVCGGFRAYRGEISNIEHLLVD